MKKTKFAIFEKMFSLNEFQVAQNAKKVMPDLQRYIYNLNQIKKDNAIFLTQKVFTFVTFSIDFYIQEMRKSLLQRTRK